MISCVRYRSASLDSVRTASKQCNRNGIGLGSEDHFQNYHRVLNRARWNSRAASRILLELLVNAFAGSGPLIVGLDDTIERRWGRKIQARGIYRDPVRSSHSHFVKTSGLRWLSLMWLVEIPWAGRVWALPFLPVLALFVRYHQKRNKTPQNSAGLG